MRLVRHVTPSRTEAVVLAYRDTIDPNRPTCGAPAVEPAPQVRDADYEEWWGGLSSTYPRLVECFACHGTGRDPFADRAPLPCYRCAGAGAVVIGAYNGPPRPQGRA